MFLAINRKFYFAFFLILSTSLSFSSFAGIPDSSTRTWLKKNLAFDVNKIADNISPSDGEPGAVVAVKARSNPNYYYHWVRDAGITIDALIQAYPTMNSAQKKQVNKIVSDYLDFSTKIQKVNTLTGLGEPKFNVDGSSVNEPWARPQNDGPALRVISLIHWANKLIAGGNVNFVTDKMYKAELPATSPIKMDLEYISYHWNEASYDLWEEVKGNHFYTLMVERRALLEGAKLAKSLKDDGAARWYTTQALAIENVLENFWDPARGYIVETLNRVEGKDYKDSNVDTGVILGLLHGDMNDGFFSWDDPRVVATLEKITATFAELYPINHQKYMPGVAIGRYPEDKYSGYNFSGGNPWPLCTLAMAEAFYRSAKMFESKGEVDKAWQMYGRGDQFVERVRYHANADGSLNEQINRNTGFMTSVSDLTWNYAALLSTRQALMN